MCLLLSRRTAAAQVGARTVSTNNKILQLSHMLISLLFVRRVLSDIDSLEEEKRVIQKVQLSDHTKLPRSCADFAVLLPSM
jgi:hypothetical protein